MEKCSLEVEVVSGYRVERGWELLEDISRVLWWGERVERKMEKRVIEIVYELKKIICIVLFLLEKVEVCLMW